MNSLSSSKISKFIKSLNHRDIFLLISFIGTSLFFILGILYGPRTFEWLAMENNSDFATLDHFFPILTCQHLRDTYTGYNGQYPPLSYLIFYAYGKMLNVQGFDNIIPDARIIAQYPYAIMLYVPYICFCFLMFVYAISELKLEKKYKVLLTLAFFVSTPMFSSGLERGNMVMLAGGFLVIALVWRESEVKWKQEMALILIALSAGIKMYPAIFGILYLKRDTIFQAIRLVIYGAIALFGPFVLFNKGSFMAFWDKNVNVMADDCIGRVQYIRGIVRTLGVSYEASAYSTLVLGIMLLAFAFLTKSNIRKYTYMCAVMIFIPNNQFRYMLIFYIIPLSLLFVSDGSDLPIFEKWFDTILLALTFTIPVIPGLITHFEMNFGLYTMTYVEVFLYVPAWIFLFGQFLFDIADWIKIVISKKQNNI